MDSDQYDYFGQDTEYIDEDYYFADDYDTEYFEDDSAFMDDDQQDTSDQLAEYYGDDYYPWDDYTFYDDSSWLDELLDSGQGSESDDAGMQQGYFPDPAPYDPARDEYGYLYQADNRGGITVMDERNYNHVVYQEVVDQETGRRIVLVDELGISDPFRNLDPFLGIDFGRVDFSDENQHEPAGSGVEVAGQPDPETAPPPQSEEVLVLPTLQVTAPRPEAPPVALDDPNLNLPYFEPNFSDPENIFGADYDVYALPKLVVTAPKPQPPPVVVIENPKVEVPPFVPDFQDDLNIFMPIPDVIDERENSANKPPINSGPAPEKPGLPPQIPTPSGPNTPQANPDPTRPMPQVTVPRNPQVPVRPTFPGTNPAGGNNGPAANGNSGAGSSSLLLLALAAAAFVATRENRRLRDS